MFIFRKLLPLTELPDERVQFTLGMYGAGDFFDMKGVCEEFFEKVGMARKNVIIHLTAKILPASGTTGKYRV